jgi:hypothetical protein
MWKSPINIFQKKIVTEIEGDILKAVHEYGVVVDKDELLKALAYDRGQYDKGFADGKREVCQNIVNQLKVWEGTSLDSVEECAFKKAIEIVKEEGRINEFNPDFRER